MTPHGTVPLKEVPSVTKGRRLHHCLAALEGSGAPLSGSRPLKGCRILSWSADGTLRFWSWDVSPEATILRGLRQATIRSAQLSDGRVLSCSQNCALRIWDPVSGACVAALERHRKAVMAVTHLPGSRLLSRARDHALWVWDLTDNGVFNNLSAA